MNVQGWVSRRKGAESAPVTKNSMLKDTEAEEGRECWRKRNKSNMASLYQLNIHIGKTKGVEKQEFPQNPYNMICQDF